MKKLASLYRAAQLVAHAKHNLVSGISFFADHEFLAEAYAAYESAYDDVVERMIGLGDSVDIPAITEDATKMAMMPMKESTNQWSTTLLKLEEGIRKEIDSAIRNTSNGTQNLLQGLADDSEKRSYKLQQR